MSNFYTITITISDGSVNTYQSTAHSTSPLSIKRLHRKIDRLISKHITYENEQAHNIEYGYITVLHGAPDTARTAQEIGGPDSPKTVVPILHDGTEVEIVPASAKKVTQVLNRVKKNRGKRTNPKL